MDELAYALGMDPVELRIQNEPEVASRDRRALQRPASGRVHARRRAPFRLGSPPCAARRAVREGRWLIGYGMAAAIRMHFQGPAKARVRMGPDGIAVVQSDMTDIGGGTYTILTQVAAEGTRAAARSRAGRARAFRLSRQLGIRRIVGRRQFEHSGLPRVRSVAREAGRIGVQRREVPVARVGPPGAVLSGGRVTVGAKSEAMSRSSHAIIPRAWKARVRSPAWRTTRTTRPTRSTATGRISPKSASMPIPREIRLRRMLGVFNAGRILNPKTARSQMIGGMTLGVSYALLEEAIVDTRSGAFVNRDLAEYLVPVHADIPEIDAVFARRIRRQSQHTGVKGIGELGVCGSAAAVTNAVFNATGVRVREFPITLDKTAGRLPLLDA